MEKQAKEKMIPRIMIAAAGSGSGKTTITCGLLQAFLNRGIKMTSFKCGPDYIDPMFHSEVLGIKSRNLDLFFTDENTTKYLFAKNSESDGLSIIEGVMGFYDGLAGISTDCSSYDLAKKLQTPVILIVDCKGMSVSTAAELKGFLEFRKDHGIRGVILNRISPMLYPDIKDLIQRELEIEVLGYVPEMKDCVLESRHLGLVTAKEIGNLKEIINRLAEQIQSSVALDRVLRIAEEAGAVTYKIPEELNQESYKISEELNEEAYKITEKTMTKDTVNSEPEGSHKSFKIAVAIDQAFCFYYQDNLDLLMELGAELIPFSPLEDEILPKGIQGLILGGGYPELHLEQLSKNKTMLQNIKEAIESGIPCIAECGGFMYLHERIKDRDGSAYEMVGVVQGESYPTEKLSRFGYITLTVQEDDLVFPGGTKLRGHEFHYWDSTNTGTSCKAQKPLRKTNWECVIGTKNVWAGYPHIHFYSNIKAATEFIEKVKERKYSEK